MMVVCVELDTVLAVRLTCKNAELGSRQATFLQISKSEPHTGQLEKIGTLPTESTPRKILVVRFPHKK